jgi:hypothetical protein
MPILVNASIGARIDCLSYPMSARDRLSYIVRLFVIPRDFVLETSNGFCIFYDYARGLHRRLSCCESRSVRLALLLPGAARSCDSSSRDGSLLQLVRSVGLQGHACNEGDRGRH